MLTHLRHFIRGLRNSPGVSVAAIVTCALATCLYASVVSVVDRIVLRPLPYQEPERLIQISSRSLTDSRSEARLTWIYGTAIRERVSAIASSAPALGGSTSLVMFKDSAPATFYFATYNLLRTLGVRPIAGRDFVEEDAHAPGRLVLISDDLWKSRFGRAEDVFARRFESEVSGDAFGRPLPEALRVVGVLPPDFVPPSSSVTGAVDGLILGSERRPGPGGALTMATPAVIARLRPGTTLQAATSEIASVAQSVWSQRPDLHESRDTPERIVVEPLRSGLFYKLVGFARLTMLAAVLLVALSAVNLAMLLIVQHRSHAREAAIHAALGASASTLVLAPFAEALLLAGVGCASGLGLAAALNRFLTLGLPEHLRLLAVPITDLRVIAAAAIVAAAAGLAAGLPAAQYRRRADVMSLVRAGTGTRGQNRTRWRVALLVVQMSVTTTLVGGAVIAGRNYLAVATAQGFEAENLTTLSAQYLVNLPTSERVPRIVGVVRQAQPIWFAGASVPEPLGPFLYGAKETFWKDRGVSGGIWGITAGLFEAMATPLRSGRSFTDADVESKAPVAVLNERGARLLFPSDSLQGVVGRTIETREGTRTIVGIVQDIKPIGKTTAIPGLFVPITDALTIGSGTSLPVLVRTRDGARIDTERMTRLLDSALGPGSLIAFPTLPKSLLVLQAPTFLLMLLLGLGIAAVVISATVVFVMTSMTAAMRRHEMAVRVALGARLKHVLALFARSEGGVCVLGLAVGMPLAVWFGRVLQAFVMEAGATNYMTYIIAAILMLAAVFGAVGQSVLRFHRRLVKSIQSELAETTPR